jgi:hypothetical protein
MSVTKTEAAILLRHAVDDIENARPVDGLAGEYARSVLWALIASCESNEARSLENIATRILGIRPGRQPRGVGPNDMDTLSIVLSVEKYRRRGLPVLDACRHVASDIGIEDEAKVRKTYYRHWDGARFHPGGRTR